MSRLLSIHIIVFGLVVITTGCTGKGGEIAHVRAPINEQEISAAAYMGRGLLTPADRASVTHSATANLVADQAIAAGVVSAAGGGAPLTRAGMTNSAPVFVGLEAASTVAGMLDGPGGNHFVSMAALPDVIDGKSIETADQATQFMRSLVVGRLTEWADKYGRTVRCIYDCAGSAPAYELCRQGAAHYPSYDPEALYVTTFPPIGIVDAPSDPARDRALGFKTRWVSYGANGYVFCMDPGDKVEFGPEGVIKDRPSPQMGRVADIRCRSSFSSPIERELLRNLTRDGYLTLGADFAYNHQISLRGKVYAIDTLKHADFVLYEIARETDVPNLK